MDIDDEIINKINEEIKRVEKEKEIVDGSEEEQKIIKPPKKDGRGSGGTREQMLKAVEARKQKAIQRQKEKEEKEMKLREIEEIKKKKLDDEYEEALKIKQAIEKKKKLEEPEIKQAIEKKEQKQLIKTASRDILKDKYLEEAKRRVMNDLFS